VSIAMPNLAPPPAASAPAPAELEASLAQAIVGAPTSERAAAAAAVAYRRGRMRMDRHEWGAAEAAFREALGLDGSVAAYHAALGDMLMVGDRPRDAEAAYTAAVLIDLDNAEYRARLKEARARR
jgi:hypothetical protein